MGREENIPTYKILWRSEGAHRLLYRTLAQISRKLGKERNEGLTLDELENNLTLRDLACISPPTIWERLYAWRSDDRFYKNIGYHHLRMIKIKKINEKAERGEELTEGELAYAFHCGIYTSGECLEGALKRKVEGIIEEAIIKPLLKSEKSKH